MMQKQSEAESIDGHYAPEHHITDSDLGMHAEQCHCAESTAVAAMFCESDCWYGKAGHSWFFASCCC